MEYIWSKLSIPLALFEFECSIAVSVSYPVGAPAGIFLVSGVVCLVIMNMCWGGAARVFLEYLRHLVSWFCGVENKIPVASLMPTWLHI
jgi:hypothetical protein